jgi:nucleoside-diphosphate-sugar epimerase
MRILFTGATTLAGRRLFAALCQRGHHVTKLPSASLPKDGTACRADQETEEGFGALPDERFEALVHFVSLACVEPPAGRWRECCRQTLQSTARLLRWADGRVGRMMVASSCALYGHRLDYTPADERHPVRPDTVQALNQYAQEQLVHAFCSSHCVPLVILRLGTVYGPDADAQCPAVTLARQALANDGPTLHGAVGPRLSLIHQDDVASLGETLLEEGYGIYNVVNSQTVSAAEYQKRVLDVAVGGASLPRLEHDAAAATGDYSCERLRRLHGVWPRVSLEEGIEGMLGRLTASAGRTSKVLA